MNGDKDGNQNFEAGEDFVAGQWNEVWVDLNQNIQGYEAGEVRSFHMHTSPNSQFLIDGIYTVSQPWQTFWYHCDYLGSPRLMTDAAGNVVWKQDYTAFGSDYGTITTGNTHKFTGHVQDAATGQYYAKARYFTTQLGRWSQPEPLLKSIPPKRFLLNPQELNPYIYCANNPTRFVDPDGKFMLIVEYNRTAQYGSKALVWNGLLPDGIYNMKTRADIKGTNVAVKSGIYDYKLGKHEGSYFPNHDALIINNNKAVPTEAPNPAQGGKSIATGIHSHAGNPETANNQGKTGSAGCWTVPAVQSTDVGKFDPNNQSTWYYYNDYISNFEDHPSGKAVLIRPAEIIEDVKNLFNKDETK